MVLRRLARAAALAAPPLLVPLLAPLAAGAAAPGPGTTASAVSLRAPRPLAGLAVGQLVVRVHLQDPRGVLPWAPASLPTPAGTSQPGPVSRTCPCALLASSSTNPQAGAAAVVALRRVSGSAQDGDWEGSAPVTAAQAGRWSVDDLLLRGGALVPGTVLAGATAVVVGSAAPVLHIGALSSTPVDAGTRVLVGGRVTLGAARPAARLRLAVWSGRLGGGPPSGPVRWVRTDADGRYAFSQLVRGDGSATVVTVSRVLGDALVQQASVRTSWLRTPVAASAVLAGTRVTVRATLPVLRPGPALLQRRSGRSWTTVATAPVVRGRATLVASGAGTYRVLLERAGEWRSGMSGSLGLLAR